MTPNEEIRRALELEQVAHILELGGYNPRNSALCRSAARVIEAAKVVSDVLDNGNRIDLSTLAILREALAAHAKNEQGTGEGV